MIGGKGGSKDKQSKSTKFLQRAWECGLPGNTIIILDSHSDPFTGEVQTSKGGKHYAAILDVLKTCLGSSVLREMARASTVARGWCKKIQLENGDRPWPQVSPKVRGGWRVLIILACGATITVDGAWKGLKKLIEE